MQKDCGAPVLKSEILILRFNGQYRFLIILGTFIVPVMLIYEVFDPHKIP